MVEMVEHAIELEGINKSFGPVRANRDIDLTVDRGTIHGIIGENGAGKSTLMSILYGFYQADSGSISVAGRKVTINSPNDAIDLGIGMVHQHFMLVENFTVLENVMLGAEGAQVLSGSVSPGPVRNSNGWSANTHWKWIRTRSSRSFPSGCSSGSRSSKPFIAAPTR